MTEETKNEIETRGFVQIVEGITRTWEGQADSIIDHCWVNCLPRIMKVKNIVRAYADHNIVGDQLRMRGITSNSSEFDMRGFEKMNKEKYLDKIKNLDWTELYNMTDPDVAVHHLEEKVLQVINEETPMITVQPNSKHKSWISGGTRELMKERDRKREEAKRTQEVRDWTEFRRIQNKVSAEINKDKKNLFNKKYNDFGTNRNIKQLYSTTKKELGWKTGGSPATLVYEDKLITAPKEVVNAQIKYYTKKIEDIGISNQDSTDDPLDTLKECMENRENKQERTEMKLKPTNMNETVEELKKLGNSKAWGHEGIDEKSLKMAGHLLAGPITHVINLSIEK